MSIVVIGVVALAVVALVLIVWAPWRRVRAEGPLPPEIEAQILLGQDPSRPGPPFGGRRPARPWRLRRSR